MTLSPAPAMALTRPLDWPWAASSPPLASSEGTTWQGGLLRSWRGTSAVMAQPPLDHHYAVMHLGGAKHVTRQLDGPTVATVVENHSITLVPAGSAYLWKTQGPIAFAHLYIAPAHLDAVIARNLEGDGRTASLIDKVGCRDALLAPLMRAMLADLQVDGGASRLRLDALFDNFCLQLVHRHMSRWSVSAPRVVALAPCRLRRVLDFVEANLDRDLALADLADAAGSSQAHFSRGFQLATGCSPYRYVILRRVEHAKVLLSTGDAPLTAIAAACGFLRTAQFAKMFKRVAGLGPKRYRMNFRPR